MDTQELTITQKLSHGQIDGWIRQLWLDGALAHDSSECGCRQAPYLCKGESD